LIKKHGGAAHIQCWKDFCCTKIILTCTEFEKFGIQILENRAGEILPSVVALLKVFADVVHFCDKENSCILAAVPSANCKVYYDHSARDWLQRSG